MSTIIILYIFTSQSKDYHGIFINYKHTPSPKSLWAGGDYSVHFITLSIDKLQQ